MNTRLTRSDFDAFTQLPGIVSAEERAALYAASDAIQAEARNEREAHQQMCSRCDSGLTYCTTPQACERASGVVRQVPQWKRSALPGSNEIPNWLLAVLLGLAVAVVLFVAPGAFQP